MQIKTRLRNRKKSGIYMVLICILLLEICACSVPNFPENSFYRRTEPDSGEAVDTYAARADEIYDEAFERFMNPDCAEELEGTDLGDKLTRKILGGYQRTYYVFRTLSPVICISSIVLGVLMLLLSMQNKRIKRIGLFVFIIGIPVTVLLIVYGVGIFNGIVLY